MLFYIYILSDALQRAIIRIMTAAKIHHRPADFGTFRLHR